ncbi:MAG: hypothetical protein QXE92_03685 [Thermofilaceae archaeon]
MIELNLFLIVLFIALSLISLAMKMSLLKLATGIASLIVAATTFIEGIYILNVFLVVLAILNLLSAAIKLR